MPCCDMDIRVGSSFGGIVPPNIVVLATAKGLCNEERRATRQANARAERMHARRERSTVNERLLRTTGDDGMHLGVGSDDTVYFRS
jgi:hypothetical protein